MKRKLVIITCILILIALGGYLYLRYSVLKAEDFKPDNTEAVSALDLRPSLIAKLKQIVKDGSKGLYVLNIGKIEPSVSESSVDAFDISIHADTGILSRMHNLKMAPDKVYNIKIKGMHITGLGIGDLLSKKDVDLSTVKIDQPVIEVYNKKRLYNAQDIDTFSIYEKVSKNLEKLSIKEIIISNARLISYKNNQVRPAIFTDININLKNILIDSTTEYDKSRFLFAKEADLSVEKYSYKTSDSLYTFNSGRVNISATSNSFIANNIEFIPRHTKAQFQKMNTERKDRMIIKIPKVVLTGIDWWTFINSESLIAEKADLYNLNFSDYIDKSMPPKTVHIKNYPHQKLKDINIPISLKKVNIHDMALEYEEYNPASSQQGNLYFSAINGTIDNVNNTSNRASDFMTLNAKALFMKSVPANIQMRFDLKNINSGAFQADISAVAMSTDLLNKLTEPLAMFHLKTGDVKSISVKIKGNNKQAQADMKLLYDDLYIIPLKKDADKPTGIDKQRLAGFLANLVKLKSSNPSGDNAPRTFNYTVARQSYPGFFTHLWKTILYGIVKTIGAPERLAK